MRILTVIFGALLLPLLLIGESEATWRRVWVAPVYRNNCCVQVGYYRWVFVQPTTVTKTTTINNYPPAPPRDWKNTLLDTAKAQDENTTYLEALKVVSPPQVQAAPLRGAAVPSNHSSGSYYGSVYSGPVGFYGASVGGFSLANLIGPVDPNLLAQANAQWGEGFKDSTARLHQSIDSIASKESEVRKVIGAAQALKIVRSSETTNQQTYGGSFGPPAPDFPGPAPGPAPITRRLFGLSSRQQYLEVINRHCASCHSKHFVEWDTRTPAQKASTIWLRINSADPSIHMPRLPDGSVYDLSPADKTAIMAN